MPNLSCQVSAFAGELLEGSAVIGQFLGFFRGDDGRLTLIDVFHFLVDFSQFGVGAFEFRLGLCLVSVLAVIDFVRCSGDGGFQSLLIGFDGDGFFFDGSCCFALFRHFGFQLLAAFVELLPVGLEFLQTPGDGFDSGGVIIARCTQGCQSFVHRQQFAGDGVLFLFFQVSGAFSGFLLDGLEVYLFFRLAHAGGVGQFFLELFACQAEEVEAGFADEQVHGGIFIGDGFEFLEHLFQGSLASRLGVLDGFDPGFGFGLPVSDAVQGWPYFFCGQVIRPGQVGGGVFGDAHGCL